MKEEKAGQTPEVEATSAQGVEAGAPAVEGEDITVEIKEKTMAEFLEVQRGERYQTALREIHRIGEVILTQPESRYKSLAATAIEEANLWLNAAKDENDHRRYALAATKMELAELWLIRS